MYPSHPSILDNVNTMSVCSAVAKYQVVVVKVVKVAGYTQPPLIIMGKFPSTDQGDERGKGKGRKGKDGCGSEIKQISLLI